MFVNSEIVKLVFVMLTLSTVLCGQPVSAFVGKGESSELRLHDSIRYLDIPERSAYAISGSEFANQLLGLSVSDRERAIVKEILTGNIPAFSRKLKPIKVNETVDTKRYEVVFFTTCDYMAIGSDVDYLYIPMTPKTAQYLADNVNCSLPTAKMVDVIYDHAEYKLVPQPIPPSDSMTTVPVFKQHTDSIQQQIMEMGLYRSADHIFAGLKKDIVISNKIYSSDKSSDRVVIYGWHLESNNPIQPVYNGHSALYADYSHGIRLISKAAFINGKAVLVDRILKDRNLSILLTNEGVINKPHYPKS